MAGGNDAEPALIRVAGKATQARPQSGGGHGFFDLIDGHIGQVFGNLA